MAGDYTLTFASLDVRYPPLARFKGNERASFFSEIHERHSFESFREEGDARMEMSTEGEQRFQLDRERTSMEMFGGEPGFPLVRKTLVDLLASAMKHFGIQGVYLPYITLRALRPLAPEQGSGPQLLRDRVVKIAEDQYSLLGGETHGAYVSLVGAHDDPELHWQLEMGPYWRDESRLFIEVEAHSHGLFETPEVVGKLVDASYRFLDSNVMKFIDTFAEGNENG